MRFISLESITIKKESVFYHGTDSNGLLGILTDKKIGTPYFDGVGFFLSKDFEDSHNHGQYVLVFSKIDLSKIVTDDVNDGFFYKGFLSIDFVDYIIVSGNDRRIARDFINNLLESYKSSDKLS
jgi:hypothetical protein